MVNSPQPSVTPLPEHVAIIMDGNGRWATRRGLPRLEGHRAGASSVRTVVEECRKCGIRYLTLFSFSSENWHRSADEVGGLMKLFKRYLDSELKTLLENGVRLRAIGDLERLPAFVRESLMETMERTANNQGLDLILAVSYGAREEIVHAARALARDVAEGKLSPEDITSAQFASRLWTADIPDPDLLIRTSGEMRISNFLLWQLAYSELVVTTTLWPDFGVDELHECLGEYARRERRFGLTADQLAQRNGVQRPTPS
ncbi:MAG: isoprenyl transferase [Bdellovibrionales bacterium]|nr:isoprenyl transferase [Bdellovibrionales bacterium]